MLCMKLLPSVSVNVIMIIPIHHFSIIIQNDSKISKNSRYIEFKCSRATATLLFISEVTQKTVLRQFLAVTYTVGRVRCQDLESDFITSWTLV